MVPTKWLVLAAVCCTSLGVSAQPDVEVMPQKYGARAQEFFPVEYCVTWEGDTGAYTVLPPALPVLDWGEAVLLEIRSGKRGALNETRLIIGYRAENTGVYEAPALDLHVVEWPDGAGSVITEIAPEMPAQILTAPPVTVPVRRSPLPLVLLTAALVVLVLLAFVYRRARRQGAADGAGHEASPEEQGRALLHTARRHRLDGDYYAFYRALRRASDLAERVSGPVDEQLNTDLDRRIQDTGYRGVRPSDDELEGDFKAVERLITRLNQPVHKETE